MYPDSEALRLWVRHWKYIATCLFLCFLWFLSSFQVLCDRFRLSRKSLLAAELPVLAALQFSLLVPESQVIPHYNSLTKSAMAWFHSFVGVWTNPFIIFIHIQLIFQETTNKPRKLEIFPLLWMQALQFAKFLTVLLRINPMKNWKYYASSPWLGIMQRSTCVVYWSPFGIIKYSFFLILFCLLAGLFLEVLV